MFSFAYFIDYVKVYNYIFTQYKFVYSCIEEA